MFMLCRCVSFVFVSCAVLLGALHATSSEIEEIAKQTGNPRYFMMFHGKEFVSVPPETLREFITSGKYIGALDPETKHGKAYFGVTKDSITPYGSLDLEGMGLVLAPLFFEGIQGIKILTLSRKINDQSRYRFLDKKNYLATIPDLSHLTELWHLDLSHNQLVISLDFTALPKLQYLRLQHNALTIPPVVHGLTNLRVIMLDHNKLASPPVLEGLVNLEELYLSDNLLTTPPVFKGLQNLNLVSFYDNPLTNFPKLDDQKKLRSIFVNGALLKNPEFLTDLRNIKADQVKLNRTGQRSGVTLNVCSRNESDYDYLATLWNWFSYGFLSDITPFHSFDLES